MNTKSYAVRMYNPNTFSYKTVHVTAQFTHIALSIAETRNPEWLAQYAN